VTGYTPRQRKRIRRGLRLSKRSRWMCRGVEWEPFIAAIISGQGWGVVTLE
jgi:hypothetical protein